MTIFAFRELILYWYQKNKRDFLPWRETSDHYHILVSEIMFQQTQVSRVLQKYPEFLEAFSVIDRLANASLENILRAWQGMGYNRRALYLQKIARDIIKRYNGVIPCERGELETLKGIGEYTSGAVACFAFNKLVVFLDTNIREVFLYHFFYDRKKEGMKIKNDISDREILSVAQKPLYKKDPRMWRYALMDYRALALKGERKILVRAKAYHKQSPFIGSTRQARSKIVRHLIANKKGWEKELRALVKEKFDVAINSLLKDNLVKKNEFEQYIFSL